MFKKALLITINRSTYAGRKAADFLTDDRTELRQQIKAAAAAGNAGHKIRSTQPKSKPNAMTESEQKRVLKALGYTL